MEKQRGIKITNVDKKEQCNLCGVNWRFIAGRNSEDCEKMVLPAIVFINTNHKAFTDVRRKGFMICIGWWDWSIKVGVLL